ncbi:rhodanese-like domain-containing protein [Winogradskyella jejuensis]|uniref:Rhodanese-related sulfurtransferase n=1 Tax=Winogradskyella jejuensis TaxID=1089305 RepID=A0A1M5PJD5_9FLAO|nr:rhodanese-like domain-containing protein [Winogradskyella jejuensis]SHH01878.1 Rhodanese-related sulfurtransferase [Winogradskyella jejuensis]
MGLFSFLFGKKSNNIQTYLEKEAVILDVRTQKEYDANHIDNAIHIPVSELKSRIGEVKALNKHVIAHCASGIRSAQAVQILKANGIEAINGGGISAMRKALE